MTDPNVHERVGYILSFDGVGLDAGGLTADLTVSVPCNIGDKYSGIPLADGLGVTRNAQVVGVLEKFEWNGGVDAPLRVEFYVSQQNATRILSLLQHAPKTTKINSLGWWIVDYDQEAKQWFEQAYPLSGGTVTGLITGKQNPELDVDMTPVVIKDGLDVNVYKVTAGVAPAQNKQYTLHFADSRDKRVIKAWGLVVGDLAKKAMP